MANGTIKLESNDSRLEGRIVWSSSSNGSSENSSTVNAQLQARRTDEYTTTGTWIGSLTIAGTTESFSTSTGLSSDWFTFKSFSITKKHNDDGTGKCSISGNISAPSGTSMSGASASGSEEVTLDKIPRYLTITNFKVQSKTINTAVINWATSDPRNSTHYSLNGGEWIGSATDGENVASDKKSGTFNIKNLSPNTTYKLKIKCTRTDSGLDTVSNEISFTTYDYAKITEVPNINIGSSHTVKWTNPAGATISLKLCKADNSQIINYGTVTGTSKSITPTASKIYALIPNSNTYKARYILTTTQNNKSYTNYKDFTFSVTDSNPTFSNYEYQDINPTTVALTGNNQILIKGYSNLKTIVSTDNKAVPKNSATMKSYKLVNGSKSISENYSSTADVSLSVNNVDSGTIVLYATDSRGNSTPVTKNAKYKEYTDLVIKSVTAVRGSNGVGQDVILKFNGTYWNNSFGNVNNGVTNVKYYYRETYSNDWIEGETELTYILEGDQFTGEVLVKGDLGANGFEVSKSFYIRLQVSDKLVTKTYDVTLGSGTPAIAIYKDNVAIGQKYDTSRNEKLQVNGEAYIHKNTGSVHYKAERTDTNVGVALGVDSSGIKHGVWSSKLNKWLINADESDVYLSDFNVNRFLRSESMISDFNDWDKQDSIRSYTESSINRPSNLSSYGLIITFKDNSWDYIQQLAIGNFNSKGNRAAIRTKAGDHDATDWEYLELKPTTLYNNSSGTTGTITLLQSAADFSYLEIFYCDNNNIQNQSKKIASPNGKVITLDTVEPSEAGSRIYFRTSEFAISGTSITFKFSTFLNLGSDVHSPSGDALIKIYKVLGYK